MWDGKELNHGSLKELSWTQLWCLSSDQSGVLHEVHKPGPQLEENAVQETKWCVWSQNQRGDKVRVFLWTAFWQGDIKVDDKHIPICCFPDRRERSKVPYIVRQCIEEVEKRGIDEVGIYRISGVATDIQALKTAFDTSKGSRLSPSLSDMPITLPLVKPADNVPTDDVYEAEVLLSITHKASIFILSLKKVQISLVLSDCQRLPHSWSHREQLRCCSPVCPSELQIPKTSWWCWATWTLTPSQERWSCTSGSCRSLCLPIGCTPPSWRA